MVHTVWVNVMPSKFQLLGNPKVLLENRKPFDERIQKGFFDHATEYDLIRARVRWICFNPDCRLPIPSGSYYYKYKGSRSYWNYKRYGLWDRVCQACYFDHVLDPKSELWQRRMESILARDMAKIERNIEREDRSAVIGGRYQ